ncbi:MAG: S1 RNA-binding domain-containing protein [Candidatus Aenigmatarchaeota archaeon]
MIKKKGMPRVDEFVICKIADVNPNSVFVNLEEYGKEGMVHISEVSRGWIRDIRQHVKQGQLVVGKVIRISGDNISLSLKRVHDNQKNEKIKEYGLEKKSRETY